MWLFIREKPAETRWNGSHSLDLFKLYLDGGLKINPRPFRIFSFPFFFSFLRENFHHLITLFFSIYTYFMSRVTRASETNNSSGAFTFNHAK